MTTLLYDPCLLIIIAYAFGLVGMQTDNTLILRDSKFKALEHEELAKANITIKLIKRLRQENRASRRKITCLKRLV
jgi:hypothetical protein